MADWKQTTQVFLGRCRAAGQLAADHAQRTKLVTLTLPSVHRALGRHLYGAKLCTDEFPEAYLQLDRLTAEMITIKTNADARPGAAGVVGKAKAAAAGVKDMAHRKTLELQMAQAFGKFGAAVYDKHGDQSGFPELVKPIAEARSKLAVLEADIARLSTAPSGQFLTPKRIAIAGVCLLVLIMLAVVGKMAEHSRSGGENDRENAGQVALPDFSQVDYSKGPNGEILEPFKFKMANHLPDGDFSENSNFERVSADSSEKGVVFWGKFYKYGGKEVYHGKVEWIVEEGLVGTNGQEEQTWNMIDKFLHIQSHFYPERGEAYFKAGIPHGKVTLWYPGGAKMSETTYVDGQRQGAASAWYDNGKKMYAMSFVNDKREGAFAEFDDKGGLKYEGRYIHDEVESLAASNARADPRGVDAFLNKLKLLAQRDNNDFCPAFMNYDVAAFKSTFGEPKTDLSTVRRIWDRYPCSDGEVQLRLVVTAEYVSVKAIDVHRNATRRLTKKEFVAKTKVAIVAGAFDGMKDNWYGGDRFVKAVGFPNRDLAQEQTDNSPTAYQQHTWTYRCADGVLLLDVYLPGNDIVEWDRVLIQNVEDLQ